MIISKYHWPHSTVTKGHIMMTSIACHNTSECEIFHHGIINIENAQPVLFYIATTFVSYCHHYWCHLYIQCKCTIARSEENNQRWVRIQCRFFIKCIVATLMFCVTQQWFIWQLSLINPWNLKGLWMPIFTKVSCNSQLSMKYIRVLLCNQQHQNKWKNPMSSNNCYIVFHVECPKN